MTKSHSDPNRSTQAEAALSSALLGLWENAHGAPPGNVRVLLGSDSVAIWIDGVLSPAEKVVAQQKDGQLLIQRYANELLALIHPELQARVSTISGRETVSSNSRVDVDNGNILCFFVLGEHLNKHSLLNSR